MSLEVRQATRESVEQACKAMKAAIKDVYEVCSRTDRDDTGVSYRVVLKFCGQSGYEVDEDAHGVWDRRVEFGTRDREHAGGYNFVEAAREQELVAKECVALVWGGAETAKAHE